MSSISGSDLMRLADIHHLVNENPEKIFKSKGKIPKLTPEQEGLILFALQYEQRIQKQDTARQVKFLSSVGKRYSKEDFATLVHIFDEVFGRNVRDAEATLSEKYHP